MKKFLLSTALFSAFTMMAEPPQASFYLSGFNGETEATVSNTLTYVPGNAEDEDEGIYRYVNNEFEITECVAGFLVIGADGLRLGYDKDNDFSFDNMVNDRTTMMSLCDGGPAVNCQLSPGSYKVILASMQLEEGSPMTWSIMFQKLGGEEDLTYHLLGLNDNSEPTQGNCLLKQAVEEDGETVVMYTYPRFLVESCANGFYVGTADNPKLFGLDQAFAEMTPSVSDESPMAFMAEGGNAVGCTLKPGYYSVNFSPAGTTNMIAFQYCEDQTAADASTYYLLGFNGVTTADDSMKFTRIVTESEDEETGEMVEAYEYVIDKLHISSCPEGFTVGTADGGFSYGVSFEFATMLGDAVTSNNPTGILGIYGEPYGFELPEGDYTVSFFCNGDTGMVSFLPYEDSGVDSIVGEGSEGSPVYYNLQGVRIANPGKGVFIKKTGTKVEKVLL